MGKKRKEALLKGKRGIELDKAEVSTAEYICNVVGLLGMSLNETAMLSGIGESRFYGILNGEYSISEREIQSIEKVLDIEIERERLTPVKYKM